MYGPFRNHLLQQILAIREAGLYKKERVISSPQGAEITLKGGRKVINFCSNNYLGLSSHPEVIEAAKEALDLYGYGMSSVRFICGTHEIHKKLEKAISKFYRTEDTILYAAAFDANGGLFEPLFDGRDAIISDSLNHASIIDGVRLCKAQRYRYKNCDLQDLESQLTRAKKSGARFNVILTDGVFSMDGVVAPLEEICNLADRFKAMVMVDDCHASGFLGHTGRGSLEIHKVLDRVEIITGTLGKALGGAMGGFTTGRKEIIEILRQKSRPYLFSNSLAPAIVGGSLKVFELMGRSASLRRTLSKNTQHFKNQLIKAGFDIVDGQSAIVPIMLYNAKLAQKMAEELLKKGVYVIGFSYPVVPKEKARIRVQLSAAHTRKQLDHAIKSFIEVGQKLEIIEKEAI